MPSTPPTRPAYYLMSTLVAADEAIEQHMRHQPLPSASDAVVMDWLKRRDDLASARNKAFATVESRLCRRCDGRGSHTISGGFSAPCPRCSGDGWSPSGRCHWRVAPADVDPSLNQVA